MGELGSCEGFPIEKGRHQVHPLQFSKYDSTEIYTYDGYYVTATDLERLYRRLDLAEALIRDELSQEDIPVFEEWRQLKEENFAEYLDDRIHTSVPTGNYYRTKND